MAKALGRREDETSRPQSQQQGAESWLLIVVALIAVAAVGALMALAH